MKETHNKEKDLVDEIVIYMKKKIESGEWAVNKKIPSENKLSQELNVGRGTIRAALQRFQVLGIMESWQGKGTFVKTSDLSLFGKGFTVDPRILNDMYTIRQARSIVEPNIAYNVAKTASTELIECLKSLHQQQKEAVGDQERFSMLDAQFHMTLAETTENPIIINFIGQLLDQTVCLNSNKIFGYYGGVYYHSLILDAIIQHNPELAHKYMKDHMESELIKPGQQI
ncbi:MAG: FCD domain-containing protein [Eubacteriales bacterium]|nr:FCD domain-containing protein [Eubacteriales bacterium]